MPRFEVTPAMEGQANAVLDALAELSTTHGTVRIARRDTDEWVITCNMNTFVRRTIRGAILEAWARLCHDENERAKGCPRLT